MTHPDDHLPSELPLDLEVERHRLKTRVDHAQRQQEAIPDSVRMDLMKWTDRVLKTIGWIRSEVNCPTCQQRLDTDPIRDIWTFTYEKKLPTFVYSCLHCARHVEQTFTRLH